MPRKSKSSYPDDWKEIAKRVKSEAGWQCIRCGAPHDPPRGYCLTVHHADLSPANCRWWNLLALCQRCHLHIQSKVVLERPYMFEHSAWFKPYVAGYYAHLHGFQDDRAYVMRNLDKLLLFGKPHYASSLTVDFDELPHHCGTCGHALELVRPGKWQCNYCESLTTLPPELRSLAGAIDKAGEELLP